MLKLVIILVASYICPHSVFAHVAKHVGGGTLPLQMTGEKLKNVEGFLKKSDPLYEILKKQEGPAGMSW
jgi:hypothetical protein